MQSASPPLVVAAALLLGLEGGVMASEFSYAPYAATLEAFVNDAGLVDYDGLAENRDDLDRFTAQLATLDPGEFRDWPRPEQLAFWMNAYNALTLQAVVDHYPVESIKDIGSVFVSVWDKLRFTVMGDQYTLNRIEHEVLRKQFDEPRIHIAINCASIGCPPLSSEPLRAQTLDRQFDQLARAFLDDPTKFRIDRAAGIVYLSPIFKWFGGDFVGGYGEDLTIDGLSAGKRASIGFIAGHTNPTDQTYLRTGPYRVKYLGYDWSLNRTK